MIVWGSGGDVVRIQHAGDRECRACQQVCSFRLVLRYEFFHVYGLFGRVTNRNFLIVCERCRNAWPIPDDEVPDAELLYRKAVPFSRRWGCLIFLILLLVGAPILMGFFVWDVERSRQEREQKEQQELQERQERLRKLGVTK
jgi:hypothetical protein